MLYEVITVRARPKIILAETYEEAVDAINKHKENLLGVITDVRFPKDGDMCSEAGLELIKLIKKTIPDIRITSYNVCYTKLLRARDELEGSLGNLFRAERWRAVQRPGQVRYQGAGLHYPMHGR